jgi:acyl-CoA thioesterase
MAVFSMSLLAAESLATTNHRTVFEATTSLRLDASQANRFGADLDPAWSSLVGIHGGYLTAIAIRAAQRVVGERPIRTVTTTFLRPGSIGNASVDVEVVRRGKSITNLVVSLSQSSKLVLVSQIVAADVVESTSWEMTTRPDILDFAQCVPIAPPEGIGHFDHAVAVLDPRSMPFSHGPVARVAGYMQPREPGPIDAAWLGMALDWFPPAAFTRIDPPTGGVSITYSMHVHHTLERLADGEWLGGEFHVDVSADGIALEKGRITDPGGRVLAESFHTRWTAGPDQLPSASGSADHE